MSTTLDGNERFHPGGKRAGLRIWFRLFLGISGAAVAIALALGLLVLTAAAAQAQGLEAASAEAAFAKAATLHTRPDPTRPIHL